MENEIKVIGLKVSNYARISELQLNFKEMGNVICVCGNNESGKSSAIGALYSALCGVTPKDPVRNGDGKATIQVLLGRDGNVEYEVTRIIKSESSKLEVVGVNGVKVPSPAQFLNDLIGKIAFDPSTFQKLNNEGRLNVLCEVAGVDTADLKKRFDVAYKERRAIGVQLKALPNIKYLDKIEPVDIKKINEKRKELELKKTNAEKYLEEQERLVDYIVDLESKVRAARATMESKYSDFATDPKSFDAKIDDCIKQIDNAVEISKQVEAYKQNESAKEKKAELDALYNVQENILDKIKFEKEKAVEKVGIKGLSIGLISGILEYDKVAFDSLSQSKGLTIALDIITSIHSKLKFCVVKDAMYYDDNNFKMICDKLTAKGYTVMFEIVGNPNGKKGFVMVDGEVDEIV